MYAVKMNSGGQIVIPAEARNSYLNNPEHKRKLAVSKTAPAISGEAVLLILFKQATVEEPVFFAYPFFQVA